MIYAASFAIAANTVVEVFTELGISPGRYQVTLQRSSAVPDLQVAQDSAGTSAGCFIPMGDESNGGQSSWAMSFVTDRDPVYIKHNGNLDANGNGPFSDSLFVLLTGL